MLPRHTVSACGEGLLAAAAAKAKEALVRAGGHGPTIGAGMFPVTLTVLNRNSRRGYYDPY